MTASCGSTLHHRASLTERTLSQVTEALPPTSNPPITPNPHPWPSSRPTRPNDDPLSNNDTSPAKPSPSPVHEFSKPSSNCFTKQSPETNYLSAHRISRHTNEDRASSIAPSPAPFANLRPPTLSSVYTRHIYTYRTPWRLLASKHKKSRRIGTSSPPGRAGASS